MGVILIDHTMLPLVRPSLPIARFRFASLRPWISLANIQRIWCIKEEMIA
jgi:hypothetical protein